MTLISKLVIIGIGAGFTACSFHLQDISSTNVPTAINKELETDPKMDSLIAPYSRTLAKSMDVVIGQNVRDMVVERPNSNLGNWSCDVLAAFGKDSLGLKNEPVVAVFNTGGLRASISVGPIKVGDVYKLMPFDNQVIAVKLPLTFFDQFLLYEKDRGGDPISGFSIQNGTVLLSEEMKQKGYVWVLTSDFLANGGDNMTFFKEPLEIVKSNKLIRDLFIESIQKSRTLDIQKEERIRL